MKLEFLCTFYMSLPTLPREMAPCTHQQPAPCIPVMNNMYSMLGDLSEDDISTSSNTQYGTNLGTFPSGNANIPATFLFGPTTSPKGGYPLEVALYQLMVSSFTCMNGYIKGLTNMIQENVGSEVQYR
jgi:hypothetical protein